VQGLELIIALFKLNRSQTLYAHDLVMRVLASIISNRHNKAVVGSMLLLTQWLETIMIISSQIARLPACLSAIHKPRLFSLESLYYIVRYTI